MINLITILLLALVIAIIANSINLITSHGMVFGFIQDFIDLKAKEASLKKCYDVTEEYKFKFKPLFLCPPCMCSFWGTLIFIAAQLSLNLFKVHEWQLIIIWGITILTASYIAYKIAD
jgi:hypothetical protein